MKSDKTIIRKTLMEQLNFLTNLLGIKYQNITILDVLDAGTNKEIIAKLDYPAPIQRFLEAYSSLSESFLSSFSLTCFCTDF